MSKSLPQEVTQLLLAWSSGDKTALDKLVPLVHAELHRLARQRLRQLNPEHLLQTTALVNEAYLRLIDCGNVEWRDRAHFFAIAAQLMREVLVDYTRRQHARKRGASAIRVSLDEAAATADSRSADLVALDDAMKSLAEIDLRKSRIIELRFFGGLNTPSSDSTALREMLEPVGGAAPLESRFYIARPVDEKFRAAIARHDSIVLVKGARQVGKTSLLARGLQQAREAGASVVLTDFQNLGSADLESFEKLLLSFADSFADQLDLDVSPGQLWKADRSPGINFEQFLRREALLKTSSQIIWGLDEVDRLFACDFGSEVFGLFRSWHNKRALDPAGQWRRLTLAIAYATEAHLFITDGRPSRSCAVPASGGRSPVPGAPGTARDGERRD